MKLGNFAVKEVIYGVAEHDGNILYTLDQLSSAEIAIESESTDITDKNGAVIRTIYQAKTGTFTATSALVSPVLLNAASGSDAVTASTSAPIEMPKIVVVGAGKTLDVSDVSDATSIVVMGLFPNGANGDVLKKGTAASLADKTFGLTSANVLSVPAQDEAGNGAPTYIVKYMRNATAGTQLINRADEFPDTIALTLYVAVMDPCDDDYKAAYVYIPSFTPDPSVTVSLSADSQEMDYTGNLQVSYCDACAGKVLYYIYFPEENAVTSVAVEC